MTEDGDRDQQHRNHGQDRLETKQLALADVWAREALDAVKARGKVPVDVGVDAQSGSHHEGQQPVGRLGSRSTRGGPTLVGWSGAKSAHVGRIRVCVHAAKHGESADRDLHVHALVLVAVHRAPQLV